jgi:integrase
VEASIDDGAQIPGAEQERRTVAQAIDAYLESGALDHLRSGVTRREHLLWWRERIGSHRLLALDKATIRAYLAALERGEGPLGWPLAPATRQRYLASLRVMLAWAKDTELVPVNVAEGAAREGVDSEPPGRVRYLDDDERAALLDACAADPEPRLGPLVQLALLTGMRAGELMPIEWRDVDLERGLASLRRAKGGRGGDDTGARSVALSTSAVEILREMHARRTVGWQAVFAAPPHGRTRFPRFAWNRAVERAGLEDFRFHDLRHTFAAYLLSAGATLPELAAALGHWTLAMVARYAHLETPHAGRIVERVAERLNS